MSRDRKYKEIGKKKTMKIFTLLRFRDTEFEVPSNEKGRMFFFVFLFFFQILDFQGMVAGLFSIIFPQLNLWRIPQMKSLKKMFELKLFGLLLSPYPR